MWTCAFVYTPVTPTRCNCLRFYTPVTPEKMAFLALLGLILSRIPKTFMFFRKKWSENLEGVWKVHTFASAFEQNAVRRRSGAEKKEFFERIT